MSIAEKVDELILAGRYWQAEAYLADALHQAKMSHNPIAQLQVLNEQIGFYRSTSAHVKGLAACDQALTCLDSIQNLAHLDRATSLLNIATAYRAGGLVQKALELYAAVQRIYASALDEEDDRYASLYNNMALAEMTAGLWDEAKAHLSQALTLLTHSDGDFASELATTHTNLGLLFTTCGDYAGAKAEFIQALHLFEESGNDPHRAAALSGLANIYALCGEYQTAIQYYLPALAQIEFYYGRNNDYRLTCRNCALAAQSGGDRALARKLLERSAAP